VLPLEEKYASIAIRWLKVCHFSHGVLSNSIPVLTIYFLNRVDIVLLGHGYTISLHLMTLKNNLKY
jgi:hypothetical protein